MHRSVRDLNFEAVKPMINQVSSAVLTWIHKLSPNLLHKYELTEVSAVEITEKMSAFQGLDRILYTYIKSPH
jgi:hypothetical protein